MERAIFVKNKRFQRIIGFMNIETFLSYVQLCADSKKCNLIEPFQVITCFEPFWGQT